MLIITQKLEERNFQLDSRYEPMHQQPLPAVQNKHQICNHLAETEALDLVRDLGMVHLHYKASKVFVFVFVFFSQKDLNVKKLT